MLEDASLRFWGECWNEEVMKDLPLDPVSPIDPGSIWKF